MKKQKPIIILDRIVKPLNRNSENIDTKRIFKKISIFLDTLDYWLERHNSLDNGKN